MEGKQQIYRKQYVIEQTIELIPNGANIPVTIQNKVEYVRLYRSQLMKSVIKDVQEQMKAFKEGVSKVINLKHLKIFTPEELKLIVEGVDKIDLEDLKKYTRLNGYTPEDSVVQWFWQTLYEFTPQKRSSVIHLWTGSPKAKAEGFK